MCSDGIQGGGDPFEREKRKKEEEEEEKKEKGLDRVELIGLGWKMRRETFLA